MSYTLITIVDPKKQTKNLMSINDYARGDIQYLLKSFEVEDYIRKCFLSGYYIGCGKEFEDKKSALHHVNEMSPNEPQVLVKYSDEAGKITISNLEFIGRNELISTYYYGSYSHPRYSNLYLHPKIKNLLSAMKVLENYGQKHLDRSLELLPMDRSIAEIHQLKGLASYKLYIDLIHVLDAFIASANKPSFNPNSFQSLEKVFALMLTESEEAKILARHRHRSWVRIIQNIAVMLTGVGALFVAGKLIYSYVTKHEMEGFFSKTKGQQTLEKVNKFIKQGLEINPIENLVPKPNPLIS